MAETELVVRKNIDDWRIQNVYTSLQSDLRYHFVYFFISKKERLHYVLNRGLNVFPITRETGSDSTRKHFVLSSKLQKLFTSFIWFVAIFSFQDMNKRDLKWKLWAAMLSYGVIIKGVLMSRFSLCVADLSAQKEQAFFQFSSSGNFFFFWGLPFPMGSWHFLVNWVRTKRACYQYALI